LAPARQKRQIIDAHLQFGASTMLDVSFNIARTTHLHVNKNKSFTPESFYAGGEQPNTTPNSLFEQ
jgi:hypothetical protein